MSKILIDEAVLRQALATLKTAEAQILALAPVGYIPPALGAIHATNAELGQALADDALDKMAENARELGLSYEQPAQQEPDPDELTIAYLNGIDTGKKRKPWVGLTDEEIDLVIRSDFPIGRTFTLSTIEFVRVLEAKLKEKNTKGGAA